MADNANTEEMLQDGILLLLRRVRLNNCSQLMMIVGIK